MKERRKNIRVLFDAQVDVYSEKGEIISNKAKDVSLKGVYIFSDKKPSIGEIYNVDIKLGEKENITLHFKGKVIRHDSSGFVISFIATDLKTLAHLKNILYYNSGNPEKIDEELKKMFGLE